MGLDLTLLPVEADHGHWGFSHSVLSLDRDYKLFDRIQKIEDKRSVPLPEDFTSYLSVDDGDGEPYYGQTTETPYGLPLKAVYAKDLLKASEARRSSLRNQAAWAYLEKLPDGAKVALYWH